MKTTFNKNSTKNLTTFIKCDSSVNIKCTKTLKPQECDVYVDIYILTICGLSLWLWLCKYGEC